MDLMLRRILMLCFLASSVGTYPTSAFASAFYTHFAGGVARWSNAQNFFSPSSMSSTSSLGYDLDLGIFFRPASGDPLIEFQFGILDKFQSVSSEGSSYVLHVPYPVVRVQFSLLYFGVGYTPFVFYEQDALSVISPRRAIGGRGMFGEVGFLWSITPNFSLAASSSLQFLKRGTTDGFSPAPAMDLLLAMRFYWGFSSGHGSKNSSEFKGWRYPFGRER